MFGTKVYCPFRVVESNMFKSLVTAAVLAVAGTAASAATCTFGPTSSADVWASTACVGQVSGNDSAATVNAHGGTGIFGINTWSQDSKWEAKTNTYSPSGLLSILKENDKKGTWSVTSWAGIGSAALVVKGSNNWAAYLLDTSAGLTGGWTTLALTNNGGNQPGISHISLYTTPAPAPVPLPASALLLVAGMGGLAALRRRKKA